MKKQDWLSVFITAIVGFFAGSFLYVTGDVATYDSKAVVPAAAELSEFIIVGDVYGGCLLNESCPSFQVLNDRSYRYLRTPTAGAEQVLRTGTLPRDLQNKLRQVLTVDSLTQQARVIEPSFCNSFVEGIDIKYKITLAGVVYELNSCGTDIDDNGVLWATLGEVWDYFETSGNN